MTVHHNPDRHGSILRARRQHAIKRKQTFCTYPILAILLLVYHVWGMATATPLVCRQVSPSIAPRVVQLQPSTLQHPGPSSIEVILHVAENLLLQTAGYSILLPRETTSAQWTLRSATFSSLGSLGTAADTVCCFKATLLFPHEFRPKVKNWLSEEPVPKALSASSMIFCLQTTVVMALVVLLAAGLLISHARPETDDLFHPAAALLFLLFCIDLLLGQPKLDMALMAVVLFPQLGVAAMIQLAAFAAPILLAPLYGFRVVIHAFRVITLHDFWLGALTIMIGLLFFIIMMHYVLGGRRGFYLLVAVLFTPPFMAVLLKLGACFADWSRSTDLLDDLVQLCYKCAPVWFALAEHLRCLSVLRFVGWPTLQFILDTFFTKEKFPATRLVSIARVYTSIGMLFICCSEHMAHSLLLLLLLMGGIEPNPGPAMNILAICTMMVLSPRPRNSMDLAGAMELMFNNEARSPTAFLSEPSSARPGDWQAPAADLPAEFMKNTPYKKLGMPVSRFKSRYGKEVGPNMISSFEALFGASYGECRLDDLPKLAQSVREAPETWVTSQCQHRWFLVAKALQSHNRSTKSALNNDTQLWAMLARVTDAVGHLFGGTDAAASQTEAAQANEGPTASGSGFSPEPGEDDLAYESDHLEPWERHMPDSPPQPRDRSQQPAESSPAPESPGYNPVRPANLRKRPTEFVDDYGDYDGRVQECDDDDNPIDSDLEESLDTEQAGDPEALGDLLDEATRAEHDGEDEGDEEFSDDDAFDPKPKPPPTIISATQFSPGRRRNKEHLLQQKHKYRKKSTARQYHPKQKKFMEWAELSGRSCTVTSATAFAYLCNFTRKGAKWHMVESHLKALRDLQQSQKVAGSGQQQSIRDDADIRLMMSNLQAAMAQMKRESYADRGAFSLMDGYSQAEKVKMADALMQQNGKAPAMHLAMLLLMDATLMRGDDARRIQLCDMFYKLVEQTRPHSGFAFGTVTDQGKVNRNGREEFAWLIRHRDPLQCGVGATLRWLLWRYEFLDKHTYPDMSSRSSWYDTYLFYGYDRDKELSYVTHLSFLSKLMQSLGIMSKKKTHAPRGSGARDTYELNVDLKDIAMLGKWSNEHIVKSYVNGIPLNAVLARAGFQNAVHMIPRSTVEAPQMLLDLIFPGIEEMLEDKKQDNLHHVQEQDKDAVDMAAANYLEFLKEGRRVILEDAAILQDQYPDHRIFKLPCFRLPAEGHPASPLRQAWAKYKAEVLDAHARSVADNLQVEADNLDIVTKSALLGQENQHLKEKLETATQQMLHMQHEVQHKTTVIEQLSAAFARLTATGVNRCRNVLFSVPLSDAPAAPAPGEQQPENDQANQHRGDGTARARCSIPLQPVSKGLKTLASAWQEYRYGTETKPSIRELINDHGGAWQKAEYGYDRKLWWKKRKVISAVYAVRHIKSVSATEALKILEEKRLATPKASGNGCMGVCEFVEKFLPRLDDKIDVTGKCRADLNSGWRSFTATDPQFAAWQDFLANVRSKFDLDTALL